MKQIQWSVEKFVFREIPWHCCCGHTLILHCVLQAITKFESLANQIQKNAGDIDERLHMIESVRLFKQPPPKPGGELPEAKVSRINSFCVAMCDQCETYILVNNIHARINKKKNGLKDTGMLSLIKAEKPLFFEWQKNEWCRGLIVVYMYKIGESFLVLFVFGDRSRTEIVIFIWFLAAIILSTVESLLCTVLRERYTTCVILSNNFLLYHRSTLSSRKTTALELWTHLVANIMPLAPYWLRWKDWLYTATLASRHGSNSTILTGRGEYLMLLSR